MKKLFLTRPLALSAGILLVLPSLYFVVSALLNYGFGEPSLWNLIEPIFEKPENKTLGLNINLLILFGPLAAILINLPQVIHLQFLKGVEEIHVSLSVQKFSYSWLVIGAGSLCVGILFFYLAAENCLC